MTSVAVLVPQYGRTDFTERAVNAVHRSTGDLQITVHVHDNGSAHGPGTIGVRDDVVLTTSPVNLGFGPAMNRMAADADADYLLLLNNDTVLHPAAISRLVATAEQHDGPVVPMYRDFEGRSLELGGGLGEGGRAWQLFHHREPPTGMRTVPHRADYGSAAAMLVRRELFHEFGGFDDVYAPAYYEDTDLCLRLAAAGHPTLVEPRALVLHYEGGTAGTDEAVGLKQHQARNRTTFVERWADRLADNGPVGLHRAVVAATEPAPGQPRILWLGGVLPRGDRDGGGRRTMEMLTLLRRQGAGIAFHARSCHDPDWYGARLAELGIPWFGQTGPGRWAGSRRVMGAFDDLDELLAAAPWDVVVPFSARLSQQVEAAVRTHAPGAALVIDNGDVHFLRHDRGRALGVDILDTFSKEEELAAYAAADGVITSSEPEDVVLHEEFRDLRSHVFAVAPPAPVDLPPAPDGDVMFLGNFGHPPNTDAVTFWVDEVGPAVAERLGSPRRLRVVGSATGSLAADDLLDVAGWVPDLADEFARTRVFLAPLRYGAGTKGKLVEALAHGVPVVTTTIGAEGFPQRVVDAMLVADDAAGLAEHTAALLADDERWRAQREQVVETARWFHEDHAGAGPRLSAWLLARAIDRRAGRTGARLAPASDTPTDAPWIAETTAPDRPFDPLAIQAGQPTTPDPVFVLGAPRSGTSMMAHALGQHPDLWTGEESDFLAPLLREARKAWEGGRVRGDLHWLAAGGVSWDEFAAWLGLGLNGLYTSRADGRRWVEQTPQYTFVLPLLAATFPGARFVYMLRDGRSVVHSLRHFVRPVEHERASRLWARHVREGLAFQQSDAGDRLYVARYAEVVGDTQAELERIQRFLDLDPVPGPAAFISDRGPINSSFTGESSKDKARTRWADWTTAEREQFHAAAGDLLVELGFEPDSGWLSR